MAEKKIVYSLKEGIPPVYPVLRAPSDYEGVTAGQLLDGNHRVDVKSDWHEVVLDGKHPDFPVRITCDREFYTYQLVLNKARREVDLDEVRLKFSQIADEIIKEEGHGRSVVDQVSQYTGFEKSYVYEILPDRYKLSRAPSKKQASKKKGKEEDGPQEYEKMIKEVEKALPSPPKRGSRDFEHAVEDLISKSLGIELESLQNRIVGAFPSLSVNEAKEYIHTYAARYEFWDIVYNPDGSLRKEKKPREGRLSTPKTGAGQPTKESSPTRVLQADPLYEQARHFYPEHVLSQAWNVVPDRADRMPFMNQLFLECWAAALETRTPREIFDATYAQLKKQD